MNILVVYYQVNNSDRKTIEEHLRSFEKYSDYNYFYLNAYLGIPYLLTSNHFDIIIFHYTFLSQKWAGPEHFESLLYKCRSLKKLNGYKVAMPQDEYVYSNLLCNFFKDFKIDTLFTLVEQHELHKIYPVEKTGLKHIVTVMTGYVDEHMLKYVSENFYKPHHERTIDIGYRARKLPFWLGRHGTLKWILTDFFQEHCKNTNLNVDLSNEEKDVFMGDDWYKFLASSRIVLGCESGASLWDEDGTIREKVERYVEHNKKAKFDEVEEECFKGLDNNLPMFVISPRHFEACMTRTCQVMFEGNYLGILKPNVHFIELKKDFSNIDEVMEKIKDKKYCETIAENSYRDLIQNADYTYRSFVKKILNHCIESSAVLKEKSTNFEVKGKKSKSLIVYLPISEQGVKKFFVRSWYYFKITVWFTILKLGLRPTYLKLKKKLLKIEQAP